MKPTTELHHLYGPPVANLHRLAVDLQAMPPMDAKYGGAKSFEVGDVVIGIDHSNLEFYAVLVFRLSRNEPLAGR